jgi:hypothetical protein
MRIARLIVLGFVLVAASAGSALAGKDQVKFVGVHPIPKGHGGGLCHIEGLHVHVYMPTDIKVSYRVDGGAYYFIGDPTRHGWEGEHFEYTGHHPIHVVGAAPAEPVYCYLSGEHVHAYAPPPMVVADFEMRGGVYVFLGDVPPAPVVVVKPVVKPVVVAPRPRGVVIEVIVDDHHHHHHKWKWKKHKHKRHHHHGHDDWDDD